MSIIPNGATIKSVNVNGVNMKEVYANSVKVFGSEREIFPGEVFTKGGTNTNGTISSTAIRAVSSTSKTYGAISCLIDLTGFSELEFTVTDVTEKGNASVSVGYSDRQYPSTASSYTGNNGNSVAVDSVGVVKVPIIHSGNKYVAISSWGTSGNGGITVTKIVAR